MNDAHQQLLESAADRKILLSPRRSGKTTTLIREQAQTGGVLLCPTHDMARSAQKLAQEMGVPVDARSFQQVTPEKLTSHRFERVCIDEANMVDQFELYRMVQSGVSFTLSATRACYKPNFVEPWADYVPGWKKFETPREVGVSRHVTYRCKECGNEAGDPDMIAHDEGCSDER